MAEKTKGKKRSAGKHQTQYARQFEISRLNGIVRVATHVGRLMRPKKVGIQRTLMERGCNDEKAVRILRDLASPDRRYAMTVARNRNNLIAQKALERCT